MKMLSKDYQQAEYHTVYCNWTENIIDETWEPSCSDARIYFSEEGTQIEDLTHCPYCKRKLNRKEHESI
jgi:hypothetical protein